MSVCNYRQVTHLKGHSGATCSVTQGLVIKYPYHDVDCPNGLLHTKTPDDVTARVRARVTAVNSLEWT